MAKEDVIDFHILENGDLKIETPSISGVNHTNADKFLEQIERLIGSKTEIKHKAKTANNANKANNKQKAG